MTTPHHTPQTPPHATTIPVQTLSECDNAGHADHWAMVGAITPNQDTLHAWLSQSLEVATVPAGLANAKTCDKFLLIGANQTCHIKQILGLNNNKPDRLINAFPAINSPYGLMCTIKEIIACPDSQDAILCLDSHGTSIYAFDTLYAINSCHYEKNKSYYVNFGAWAYELTKSNENEVILVDDPKSIRYHRAFNDIVANNGGQVPDDIEQKIRDWTPNSNEPLAPVEINMGHSCIYLYGETHGQQDEAWCQGQVLGKSSEMFFGQMVDVFDVVILREDNTPFVVKIATLSNTITQAIAVQDYIQANIWLQASIYGKTQQTQ